MATCQQQRGNPPQVSEWGAAANAHPDRWEGRSPPSRRLAAFDRPQKVLEREAAAEPGLLRLQAKTKRLQARSPEVRSLHCPTYLTLAWNSRPGDSDFLECISSDGIGPYRAPREQRSASDSSHPSSMESQGGTVRWVSGHLGWGRNSLDALKDTRFYVCRP